MEAPSLSENCLLCWFPALSASFPKRFSLVPSPYSYVLLYTSSDFDSHCSTTALSCQFTPQGPKEPLDRKCKSVIVSLKTQTATRTCTYTQCADTDVVCALRERERGVCLCLHHLLPLQNVFAVSTGSRPLHQTLGNLWISSFSKSFWVSGCVTQRGQSATGATGPLCLCGISDAFCLP